MLGVDGRVSEAVTSALIPKDQEGENLGTRRVVCEKAVTANREGEVGKDNMKINSASAPTEAWGLLWKGSSYD